MTHCLLDPAGPSPVLPSHWHPGGSPRPEATHQCPGGSPKPQATHRCPGDSQSTFGFAGRLLRLPENSDKVFSMSLHRHLGPADKVGPNTSSVRSGRRFPTGFVPCSDQREPRGSHRGTRCREAWGNVQGLSGKGQTPLIQLPQDVSLTRAVTRPGKSSAKCTRCQKTLKDTGICSPVAEQA